MLGCGWSIDAPTVVEVSAAREALGASAAPTAPEASALAASGA